MPDWPNVPLIILYAWILDYRINSLLISCLTETPPSDMGRHPYPLPRTENDNTFCHVGETAVSFLIVHLMDLSSIFKF